MSMKRCFLNAYETLFFLMMLVFPCVFLCFLSEEQKKYGYFLVPFLAIGCWLLATDRREKQLRVVANQLIQSKIRELTDNDENLRTFRETVDKCQQKNEQVQQQNQDFLKQLLRTREAFIKAKAESQQWERTATQYKEENARLLLQVESLSTEQEQTTKELVQVRQELKDALTYQQALNNEYQATFAEQHSMLDKRQAYIVKLEVKVQELMGEIKNLLQLETNVAESFPQQRLIPKELPYRLSSELKKIASRIENTEIAVPLMANLSLASSLPIHNHSLAYRQLFDGLREEDCGMLFIYAPQSQRPIFGNTLFKDWTGYGVEDFVEGGVIISGVHQWKQSLLHDHSEERSGKLIAKTKLYGQISFYYCLTLLRKGPLYDHIIGVLYPERIEEVSHSFS